MITSRRLKTLRWYARRPLLWKQFFRFVREKSGGPSSEQDVQATRAAARAWCAEVAVPIDVAVEHITGQSRVLSLAELHPNEVAHGARLQADCPVKMGSGVNIDLLYTLAEAIACTRAVETGVAFGWSSFALLESVSRREGRLISTDMPYPLRDNDAFVGCVVPERLRGFWTLLRMPDRDGLPGALRRLQPLDLAHYDSDKSVEGRNWAYPRMWDALRPGGVFVSDDVQDNLAFRAFAETVGCAPVVAAIPERGDFKYSGILVKPRHPAAS
jgi:hypothetical protein